MTEHEHRGEFTIRDTPNPFEHPMQRRAVALDLAIKTYGGAQLTKWQQHEEVPGLARMYEDFIRGEAPAKEEVGAGFVFNADGPEPPPGRYQDKDADSSSYWVNDGASWRYHDVEGPGAPYRWEHMGQWAPFVRIGDLPAEGGE
jgi:hypothetical protein